MNPQYSRYYNYIKPVIKNKVVKTYGSFIFSLITISIFTIFALKPTISTIVSLQKTINEQQQILNQLDTKVKNLTQGKANYENLSTSTRSKLLTKLPPFTSLPCLIDNLSTLAIQSQASISGIQFQPVDIVGKSKCTVRDNDLSKISKDGKFSEVEFNLNMQGSYPQSINFINSMVAAPRLINIKSINFGKRTEGPLVLSIDAIAYYIKN